MDGACMINFWNYCLDPFPDQTAEEALTNTTGVQQKTPTQNYAKSCDEMMARLLQKKKSTPATAKCKAKAKVRQDKDKVKVEKDTKQSPEPPMKRLRTKSSSYPAVTGICFHHGYHMLLTNTVGCVFSLQSCFSSKSSVLKTKMNQKNTISLNDRRFSYSCYARCLFFLESSTAGLQLSFLIVGMWIRGEHELEKPPAPTKKRCCSIIFLDHPS